MGLARQISVEERITAARLKLAERFVAIEDRVTDTVQQAADTVNHATSEIRGTVTDATQSVRGLFDRTTKNLRGIMDVRRQATGHPWQGLLLAVGTGLVTRMLSKSSDGEVAEGPAPNPITEIVAVIKREIAGLGEAAVTTATRKIRENVESLTGVIASKLPQRAEAVNERVAAY